MSKIDIFVSPTGIITLDHMENLKYNTYVGNTGHFDNGGRLGLLRGLGRHGIDHIEPQKIVIVSSVSHGASRFANEAFGGVFSHFSPISKKVRSPTASAEMTRQVEISTLSAHQMAHAGVVAHTSSWTPAACEPEESAPWNSDVGGLPVLPVGRREQGDKVVCILMGLIAGNAAGYWGGAINTGIEDFLVLPAVPVVPFLPGPAHRDGFSHVLGLRIVVPEALRCPSGQLLRQRQRSPLQTLRRLFRQLLRQRQSLVDLSILHSSVKNDVRCCIWLVERRSPVTWVLSSYTWECLTKRVSLVKKCVSSVARGC